jgi:hypothetical protein
MKKLLLVFLALVCVSCEKKGTYVPSENAKADFDIEFLFECDGVKMYRFYDGGRFRYFTTGNGKMIDSTYTQRNGKSNTIINDTVIQ